MRMSADNEQPPIEDEGRNRVDSVQVRLERRGVDPLGVAAVGKGGRGLGAVEAGVGDRSSSTSLVADVRLALTSRHA